LDSLNFFVFDHESLEFAELVLRPYLLKRDANVVKFTADHGILEAYLKEKKDISEFDDLNLE
jgi:hypothetical protein